MQTAHRQISVQFDPALTDAESLANAANVLLKTALSTPGAFYAFGDPHFGEFVVAQWPTAGTNKYLLYDFDADELATTNVYDSYAEAVEDAEMLDDVIVVSVPAESLGGNSAHEGDGCEEEV